MSASVAVEAIGPEMRAGHGIDQLAGDPHPAAGLAHAALEHVAHAELAADLLHVDGAALVGEARIAGDHEQPAEARQRRDDVLDHAVGEISCSASPLMFWNGRTAIEGRSGRAGRGPHPARDWPTAAR